MDGVSLIPQKRNRYFLGIFIYWINMKKSIYLFDFFVSES